MFRRFLRNSSTGVSEGEDVAGANASVGQTAGRPSDTSQGDSSNSTNTTVASTTTFTGSLLERSRMIRGNSTGTSAGHVQQMMSAKAHEKLKDVIANTMKVEELMNFDSCVEAADTLAIRATATCTHDATDSNSDNNISSRTSVHAVQRIDPSTGLVDCSVLVNPEGQLLVIPQMHLARQQQQLQSSKKLSSTDRTQPDNINKSSIGLDYDQQFIESAKHFWSVVETNDMGEDYQSSVFLGHDLHMHGDKILNGFSAKGWSMAAASLALKQSSNAMLTFQQCVETLITTKQSTLDMELKQIVEPLRKVVTEAPILSDAQVKQYQKYWQRTFPDETRMEVSETRVGPFSSSKSTLQVAMCALHHYYANVQEMDNDLWGSLLHHPEGALTLLQQAKKTMEDRVTNRQVALQEMIRRTKAMEEELELCKREAKLKWDQVHATELKVSELVEEKRFERNRLREQQRLEQMLKQEVSDTEDAAHGAGAAPAPAANPSDIWDLVSAVTAEMDEGSFAPMDLPQLPMERSRSIDSVDSKNSKTKVAVEAKTVVGEEGIEVSSPNSIASRLELEEMRYELEEVCGLPQLRKAALSAEDAVENVSNALLSTLSNVDTTSRSARLAAETCLVSAGNAQAACLRSIVQLERASLTERLKQLEELENAAKEIDVRADMNQYISMDKTQPGGQSFLGDDDDGGMASALAVLNEHTDGDTYSDSIDWVRSSDSYSVREEDEEVDEDDELLTTEYLEESIDMFFQSNQLLLATAPNDDKTQQARNDFDARMKQLCRVGQNKNSKSRSRRSTICYTMNAKRSSNARIHTELQFDGLCSVFAAVLSGCTTDSRGVSNAKLLLNLSQQFYFQGEQDGNPAGLKEEVLYIKSRIANHPMWEKNEFWDSALNQAVGESLAHSGVMANFERASSKIVTTTTKKRSEWTQTHKTRWHDLKVEERYEAASQVHAVVFAQLSAMSHTMTDFGCSLEQTSSFVRRMCIRNRLPMSQRTALLRHLIQSDSDKRPKQQIVSTTAP